jgi:hypothetical protein
VRIFLCIANHSNRLLRSFCFYFPWIIILNG